MKRVILPFEVRLIQGDGYMFVHLPPNAEILKIDGRVVSVVESADEAEKAVSTFRRGRKRRGAGRVGKIEMPDDVAQVLAKLPEGTKIAYDATGKPRLVKARKRRKSGE